jgi:riboflavin synthase
MFTGIVEERGEVVGITAHDRDGSGGAARLTVRGPRVTADAEHGDSIAVSGVCLTVVDRTADTFTADVMAETLHRTTIGALRAGDAVNLERSVTSATRLGGHLVQGHVDGTGVITARNRTQRYDEIRIAVGVDLAPYLAAKGSVAVDGISLTVVDVVDTADGAEFGIGVIPETRSATTIGSTPLGGRVNVEVDVIAKYVERLLTGGWASARAPAVAGPERRP